MLQGLDALRRRVFDAVVWTAAAMFVALLGVHAAHAGEQRHDVNDPRYQAECGNCHIAYPPRLLAARDWQVLLDTLPRHFGTDAGIEPAERAALGQWLMARAGRDRGVADPAAPRISTSRWFRKEHREVEVALRDGRLKSAADCAACHRDAAQGDFDEHRVRLPAAPVAARR